ncbi:MAG TPA: hypothetical protein G4N95_03280 [Anaerolineae bacterium]|nr:hypothetical protein [Anaerolineae bacterium]
MLDVCSDVETEYIALPFGLYIPIDELHNHLYEVPHDKLVGTFCSGGDRAGVSFAFLRTHGYDNAFILKVTYTELMKELLPGKIRKLLQDEV